MKRKKYEENDIKSLINEIDSEYEFIEIIEFKGINSKIKIKHLTCERDITIIFNNYKNGRRCKYCNGNRIDNKKFLEMVKV